MKNVSRNFIIAALVLVATAAMATAAPFTLNCESGCSNQAFGGAIWSTASVQPSGTGVFKPFLREHVNGSGDIEDGHNTDAASQNFLNDEVGGIWTHALQVSDLDNIATINGSQYYEFMLDLGEPATDKKSLISLDQFKICIGDTGTLVKADDCPTSPYKFDLDAGADRSVLLDYNLFGGGNGNSDLFVYIPVATLVGVPVDKFFYLYAQFGSQAGYAAEGTFEEWAFQHRDVPTTDGTPTTSGTPTTNGTVPEPALLSMLGLGLAGAAYRARRRS